LGKTESILWRKSIRGAVVASSIADRNLNFCQLGKATATIGFEKLFSLKIQRKPTLQICMSKNRIEVTYLSNCSLWSSGTKSAIALGVHRRTDLATRVGGVWSLASL
jgi:hypothetical protein